MNRRSFFKGLVASICLSPAVCRLAEKIAIVAPPQVSNTLQINPEWVNADCEISFVIHKLK